MNPDITQLLSNWDFNPEANVRKIEGEDGIEKIQVRVDQGAFQGILQLNLDGRPDGKRPYDTDFILDHYEALSHDAGEGSFSLDGDACKELFDESARIYGRYVFLLQIKEYDRVVTDTERNMRLFDFVHRHAAQDEDRNNLQKWWPYILRIHATARAMLATDKSNYDEALEILAETRQQIEALTEVEAEEFFAEKDRSLEALDELVDELTGQRPLSERERLEQELEGAISREEFERAAQLRDQLRGL
ncbi:MAG: UvrB/UvrC motif-containing protein [Candidatus Latescibacteria bacterium]|jgi:hypothetical protein|nr:UvrB/UvrC motif-containing protein [Candidatus Latescibacterota bacterium]